MFNFDEELKRDNPLFPYVTFVDNKASCIILTVYKWARSKNGLSSEPGTTITIFFAMFRRLFHMFRNNKRIKNNLNSFIRRIKAVISTKQSEQNFPHKSTQKKLKNGSWNLRKWASQIPLILIGQTWTNSRN